MAHLAKACNPGMGGAGPRIRLGLSSCRFPVRVEVDVAVQVAVSEVQEGMPRWLMALLTIVEGLPVVSVAGALAVVGPAGGQNARIALSLRRDLLPSGEVATHRLRSESRSGTALARR